MKSNQLESFSATWRRQVAKVVLRGQHVAPRQKPTRELLHSTVAVNMRRPVLRNPERMLHYRFMAAEAYWILSGSNRVDQIAPYNRHIAAFSDDGKTFFGAYGPKIVDQLPYVVNKLFRDRTSRQAVLTIWRENPGETKDTPCTIAMCFTVRDSRLDNHVFMRSSDIWLGLPYDVFTFSMVAHLVCALINRNITASAPAGVTSDVVEPGVLYVTAASSHLYEQNFEAAQKCLLYDPDLDIEDQPDTPNYTWQDPTNLMRVLRELRETPVNHELRWWQK